MADAARERGADDRELIDRCNRGDAEAFETLYRRHRAWVYSVALRFCGRDEDALDATQETFIHLLGRFPGFELRARLTTYLYPSVKGYALRAARKRARAAGAPMPGEELAAPAPREGAPEDLARAMRELSAAHREVVVMRFVDGMSAREIGEALGIPEGTAKTRLHHALARLREQPDLKRYFDEG